MLQTDVRELRCVYVSHFFRSGCDTAVFPGFERVDSLDQLHHSPDNPKEPPVTDGWDSG